MDIFFLGWRLDIFELDVRMTSSVGLLKEKSHKCVTFSELDRKIKNLFWVCIFCGDVAVDYITAAVLPIQVW